MFILYKIRFLFLSCIVGCMLSSCNKVNSHMHRRSKSIESINIPPDSKLGQLMQHEPRAIPCLNIYVVHNYLILPNTTLSDIPEAYKKKVETYLFKKIISLLINRPKESLNSAVDLVTKQFTEQQGISLETEVLNPILDVVDLLLGNKKNKDGEDHQSMFESTLKAKLAQVLSPSGKMTVKELWEWSTQMAINMQLLKGEDLIDQIDPSMYGDVPSSSDAIGKVMCKRAIGLFSGFMEAINPLMVEEHTIACNIMSDIFKDEQIVNDLLIRSFTKNVQASEQLDFTGELTLDMPVEEFESLKDVARAHTASYAAAMYVAFKKQAGTDTFKEFLSKMKAGMEKRKQENQATLRNVLTNKGKDEAHRLYQDYLQSGKTETESFKQYLEASLESIDDIVKELGELNIGQATKKTLPRKTKKKEKHKKITVKHYAPEGDSESKSSIKTDYLQNEQPSNILVPDTYTYHFRVKKWEQDTESLLAYFRSVPVTSPDFKYKEVNNTLERVEAEKLRHDLRPIGQVIRQRDGGNYFFTLGSSKAQSALAVLFDNNGRKQKGVVDIAIATVNGKEMIYHQMFRKAKLETLFQRPSIDESDVEQQQIENQHVSERSLDKEMDGIYVVHVKDKDANTSLRLLPWKK